MQATEPITEQVSDGAKCPCGKPGQFYSALTEQVYCGAECWDRAVHNAEPDLFLEEL